MSRRSPATPIRPPPSAGDPATERPVFVAETAHRARVLRAAIRTTVVVACAWLAALVLGGAGFVALPAMRAPLPRLATIPARRPAPVGGGRTALTAAHLRAARGRDLDRNRSAKPA